MDEKTYVPSLTLNPTQAAAQEMLRKISAWLLTGRRRLIFDYEKRKSPPLSRKSSTLTVSPPRSRPPCASLPSRST